MEKIKKKKSPINVILILASAFLVASCGKNRAKADTTASGGESKAEVGAIQAAIEYGTGATHVKAGQDAAKKLKAIEATRNAQMEEAVE